MINPEEIKVSTYQKPYRKDKPEEPANLYLTHLLTGIKAGAWRKQTGKTPHTELQTFTAAGTFKAPVNEAITSYSCLIALHFNNVPDIQECGSALRRDRFVKYYFKSFNGTGFVAMIEIDSKKFIEAFLGLESYFLNVYGLIVDKWCKNIANRTIFSFDPDAQIDNNENEIFKLYLPKGKVKESQLPNIHSQRDIEHVIKQIEERGIDITGDYSTFYKIGHGIITAYGDSDTGRDVFRRIASQNTDYAPGIYDYLLSNRPASAGIASLYSAAKQNGIDPYTDRTILIARTAALQKKFGATANGIIRTLESMDQIPAEESKDIVKEILEGEFEFDTEESAIEKIELFLKRNYPMRFNLIERQTEFFDGSQVTDRIVNGIYVELKKAIGKEVTKSDIESIIESPLTPSFNPILDFFEKNKGIISTGNIEALAATISPKLNDYAKNSFPQYVEFFVRKWLVGVVSTQYGDISPLSLVLTGGQNTGKTEWFRRLLPSELQDYYDESNPDNEKDENELLMKKMIMLDDEYGGKNKQEAKKLKKAASKRKITQRASYAKRAETHYKIAVFCGTSNDTNILNDPTGNRRVIPIEVLMLLHAQYNLIDKTALLMEAWHLYKSGFSCHLTGEEIHHLNKCTEQYEQTSMEKELIIKYFDIPDGTTVSDMLTTTDVKIIIEKNSQQKINLAKLGQELKALGYLYKSFRKGKTPTYGYEVVVKNFAKNAEEEHIHVQPDPTMLDF